MNLALILLAAGDSRRFKENKLLYEWNGKPMYRNLADRLEELPKDLFSFRTVVTQYKEIGETLEKRGFESVENRESHLGIAHSIHLGIAAVQKHFGDREPYGICFAVCDQPYLRRETMESMLLGWIDSGKGIGCVGYGEVLGNPVVFLQKYERELLELRGDVGGKKVVKKHLGDLYVFHASEERELEDVDRKQEAR